ncbi:MAG: trypsin-like serine protease [Leptolyngbyaceae bacterium]|nr:trypsin-like serine protease [Leptolyngbyaceae bacterium]
MQMERDRLKRFSQWMLVGMLIGGLIGLVNMDLGHASEKHRFNQPSAAASLTASMIDRQPIGDIHQTNLTITDDISAFGLTVEPDSYIPEDRIIATNPTIAARGVFVPDERQAMVSRDFPWSAVGRLEGLRADGIYLSRCTGTLIAPDVVITNAHCVVNDRSHQPHQAIWFEPNLIDGELQRATDRVAVTTVFYATDFYDDPLADQQDWALLKLNRSLGDRYGILGWRSPSVAAFDQGVFEAVSLVGYSGDFPTDNPGATASIHLACHVLGEISDGLTHDCDSGSGASGSPLIAWAEGIPYLVGVHAGGRHNPYTNTLTTNYAISLSHLKTRLTEAINQGA